MRTVKCLHFFWWGQEVSNQILRWRGGEGKCMVIYLSFFIAELSTRELNSVKAG